MKEFKLNETWTVNVVARMHRYRIRQRELAKACGYTVPYVSMVLNDQKKFSCDAAKEKTKQHILTCLKRLEVLHGLITD